ncbi:The BTB (BR-C, ttk and bab)/POZ (Pox virus and Zinc finger) domain [Ceratobasidium sp. AG-Ba]|nr:The BTB (BR-C, ttk and bab)/POZ (Pox virus and Zinc finger) domain [Ceratobasidium sp. AG-Ba]QRW12713.1 The BTB (BR-C, ttk and bab)/POZ (Pox virus and Zinc finger) domain [Ceratobasidium sp. AG-Ba]
MSTVVSMDGGIKCLPSHTPHALATTRSASRKNPTSSSASVLAVLDRSEKDDDFELDFDSESIIGLGDEFVMTGGKHPRFWLEDGNVMLVASQPCQTHFRVHQSVLSRQSRVFKEMFSSLNLVRLKEMDDCPVVPLNDTEDDIAALLSALYDGLTLQRDTPFDVETISGQLRLATKYEITNIRRKIVAHLRDEYPLTLADIDRKESSVSEQASRKAADQLYDPIAVIKLAEQGCNVPEVLPYAWYRLARHSFSDDGDMRCARLSSDDMRRLLVGRERLRSRLVQFAIASVPVPPQEISSRCTGPEANAETGLGWCRSVARHYWSSAVLPLAAQSLDPLAALNKLARIPEERLGFCPQCAAWCSHVLNQKRAEIWNAVPHDFDIRLERATKE